MEKKLDFKYGANMIGLLIFCSAFGFVLGTMDKEKQILLDFFTVLNRVTQKLLVGAIWLTPIGTASIICSKLAEIKELLKTAHQLGYFVFLIMTGLLIYALILLPVAMLIITKINPYKYFTKLMPAIICSFLTGTKSTALSMTIELLEEKVKANKTVTNFVLPIGIINLNGTAFFLGFSIVFLAKQCGMNFTTSDYMSLGLGCTLLSMSGASVPSASMVLLITLCNTAGIPEENVAIVIAVDWLVDRMRTVNNLLGDCFTVAVVQHMSRNQLAREVPAIDENGKLETPKEDHLQVTEQLLKQLPYMKITETIV